MSGGRRAVHPPEIAHERQRRCAGRQPGANWRITSGNCANCGNSRWTRLSHVAKNSVIPTGAERSEA